MTNFFYNILHRAIFLAADFGVIGGQQPPANGQDPVTNGIVEGVTTTLPPTASGGGDGGIMNWMLLLLWGGVIVVLYIVMTRSQRKREKQAREMQSILKSGDYVVISSGMFGKIVDVGEDCFIVEFGTNRSIQIPVNKADVVDVRAPKFSSGVRKNEIKEE